MGNETSGMASASSPAAATRITPNFHKANNSPRKGFFSSVALPINNKGGPHTPSSQTPTGLLAAGVTVLQNHSNKENGSASSKTSTSTPSAAAANTGAQPHTAVTSSTAPTAATPTKMASPYLDSDVSISPMADYASKLALNPATTAVSTPSSSNSPTAAPWLSAAAPVMAYANLSQAEKDKYKSFPGSAFLEKTFCGSIDTTDPSEYEDQPLATRLLKKADIMCVSSPTHTDGGDDGLTPAAATTGRSFFGDHSRSTKSSAAKQALQQQPVHPSSALLARALVSEVTDNPKTMKPAEMAAREKQLLKAQEAAAKWAAGLAQGSSMYPARPVGAPGTGVGPPQVLSSVAFACTGDETAGHLCAPPTTTSMSLNNSHGAAGVYHHQLAGMVGPTGSNNNMWQEKSMVMSSANKTSTLQYGAESNNPYATALGETNSPFAVTIGLSMSRRHAGIGHPATVTRQSAFDLNELQDRAYKYVSSTDKYGWRAGGGEPLASENGPVPLSPAGDPTAAGASPLGMGAALAPPTDKVAIADQVHIPIIHIDCPSAETVDQVIHALASGEIFIPHMAITPEGLSVQGPSPPDLVLRFGCERSVVDNDDDLVIPPDEWPNWCLEFMHNQLYEYFYNLGARWMKRPFALTLARKVRWKTVKHMNKYFSQAEKTIASWRARGPQVLDPQLSYIEGGATPEEVARPHGIYLFRNGIPTNYFAPNFEPPYTTKMTRSLLSNVLNKSWDRKRREWASEPLPRLVSPGTLVAAALGCVADPQHAGGFLATEVTRASAGTVAPGGGASSASASASYYAPPQAQAHSYYQQQQQYQYGHSMYQQGGSVGSSYPHQKDQQAQVYQQQPNFQGNDKTRSRSTHTDMATAPAKKSYPTSSPQRDGAHDDQQRVGAYGYDDEEEAADIDHDHEQDHYKAMVEEKKLDDAEMNTAAHHRSGKKDKIMSPSSRRNQSQAPPVTTSGAEVAASAYATNSSRPNLSVTTAMNHQNASSSLRRKTQQEASSPLEEKLSVVEQKRLYADDDWAQVSPAVSSLSPAAASPASKKEKEVSKSSQKKKHYEEAPARGESRGLACSPRRGSAKKERESPVNTLQEEVDRNITLVNKAKQESSKKEEPPETGKPVGAMGRIRNFKFAQAMKERKISSQPRSPTRQPSSPGRQVPSPKVAKSHSLDYSTDGSSAVLTQTSSGLVGQRFAFEGSDTPKLAKGSASSPKFGSRLSSSKADDDGASSHLSLNESTSSVYSAIPTDEELFAIGWAKAYDKSSGNYYYFTLDRSKTVWDNPLVSRSSP